MNLKTPFLIKFAFLVTLLQPIPSMAGAKSLYLDVMHTLEQMCTAVDLGGTVAEKFGNMAAAIRGAGSDLPKAYVGTVGEETIRGALDSDQFEYQKSYPHS